MRDTTVQAILDRKLVAILRGVPSSYVLEVAAALHAGGISLIEVTFDQSNPGTWQDTAQSILAISQQWGMEVLVGAGTVLTMEQLHLAREANARYIISPNADPKIIRQTREWGLVSIPGCMTATECVLANEAGADFMKLFPAGTLGLGYLKALRGPLNHLRWIAVGGVNTGNAADFLRAGCSAVAIGSGLFELEWILEGAWVRITERAQALRDNVSSKTTAAG